MVHCFGGIRTAPVQSAASVRVFGFIWVQGLRVASFFRFRVVERALHGTLLWGYTNGSSTVGSIGQGLSVLFGFRV